ncbi:16S rRNA (guanine(527)-N(7))-methyltransferase RsmG [Clostridium chauvoei]|uniref:Ribosomal RNA small subunit methyltransferase G n=2 Tax=Clostridium chauvoei TaxID=46867 RepID=A0A1U6JS37_9CLOT|nr:16S rRNA (guanine(527)-N(7))-methyltransferase RsmG [Clostridium chauvoei]ATD56138.1 16S rRNA (guanine(527)-N(7))-methyltransferase RsmG [Clostridium chauvoei]ATD58628.1 16S rRNA (guanine(527)-N(7))-methyltransferase RsmG [Clostridium chauvoei]MBX7281433.1 16S rRNA (guanine(527)-N(7))-methyltransferase RsmG [Clostridium chauvoei]MBX7283953.1 16S rRNA (guanine(527)-N(7))-methyltransferase RsmG [Clostridium chauvoei]MBX7286169.1 16S rRNA (guanine(527)-N(7))-methyltransferase RsmG [Clostridium
MKFFDLMKEAAIEANLELSEEKYEQFIKYMRLLQEWNEKINLTAITEDEEIIKKHFIDCIKAFKSEQIRNASTIIDVGTGAGFPGLPIAIMNPNVKVTLLDSLNKRINFLNTVINELGLKNITTIHSRAEDGARKPELREKFDIATSRAVANMAVLSEFCMPYVKKGGYFVALKGPSIDEELKDADKAIKTLGGELKEIIEVEIEDTDLRHNIVEVKKIKQCPKIYPRKAGTVNKKPIK